MAARHHRAAHDRHDAIARWILTLAVAISLSATLGFIAGRDSQSTGDTGKTDLFRVVGQCDPSDTRTDVLEHVWSHRGVVIHRECILIERPSYVSPRYSVQTPAHHQP